MNKYRNRKTTSSGIKFDSAGEAKRYEFLKLLEKNGYISNLKTQISFILHAEGGGKVGKYIADFEYQLPSGEVVIEDFKGMITPLFKWKAKHLLAEYGIKVYITKKYNDDIKAIDTLL